MSYSFLEDKNDAYLHFDIDKDTGIITTRSTFDREEADKSVYYIKVKAVDGTRSDAPGHFPADTPNSGKTLTKLTCIQGRLEDFKNPIVREAVLFSKFRKMFDCHHC